MTEQKLLRKKRKVPVRRYRRRDGTEVRRHTRSKHGLTLKRKPELTPKRKEELLKKLKQKIAQRQAQKLKKRVKALDPSSLWGPYKIGDNVIDFSHDEELEYLAEAAMDRKEDTLELLGYSEEQLREMRMWTKWKKLSRDEQDTWLLQSLDDIYANWLAESWNDQLVEMMDELILEKCESISCKWNILAVNRKVKGVPKAASNHDFDSTYMIYGTKIFKDKWVERWQVFHLTRRGFAIKVIYQDGEVEWFYFMPHKQGTKFDWLTGRYVSG